MKLNILRADPAGNITIFVLDPVEPRSEPTSLPALWRCPAWAVNRLDSCVSPGRGATAGWR